MSETRVVWKFPVPWPPKDDQFPLTMPTGAEILTLQSQHGDPQIWALVDPSAETDVRFFRVAGTGHPINEPGLRYVGTFQVADGSLIFHVFETYAVVKP